MLKLIESEITGIRRKLGLTEELALIDRAWNAEMGGWESMASIAALEHGGTLVIEVYSAPALQEITLRRSELVRRINRHLPHPLIRYLTARMESRGTPL